MRARELAREVAARLSGERRQALFDARVIVETACGLDAGGLLRDPEVSAPQLSFARALADRRASGEPIQYIAGRWPFCGCDFYVGQGVLIPRPETEKLALMAAGFLAACDEPVYIDLCSGTGCIAISAVLKSGAPGAAAVEAAAEALAYCEKNARELCPRVRAVGADVFGFERTLPDGGVDLITCNPPYVSGEEYDANRDELRFEPERAFVPRGDVMSFYRYISRRYRDKLKPGGRLLFEAASMRADDTAEILRGDGYDAVEVILDDFGLKRFVSGTRPRDGRPAPRL